MLALSPCDNNVLLECFGYECRGGVEEDTHPEILVRHLLIFFGHCCRRGSRHHVCEGEEAEGNEEPNHCVAEDLHAFTWRGEGSWAVRTEGDVVCCH